MHVDAKLVDDVRDVLTETLALEDRAESLNAETPLFGHLPELDSLAVVELIVALESRFGLLIQDDDVTAEVFETLGSLAAFVSGKLG